MFVHHLWYNVDMSVEFEEEIISNRNTKPAISPRFYIPETKNDESWLVRKGVVSDSRKVRKIYIGFVIIVILSSYLIYINFIDVPPKAPRNMDELNKLFNPNNAR